jgi:hypothetical protein
MKLQCIAVLTAVLLNWQAVGQTNQPVIPLLVINGQICTNLTLIRANPAYALVDNETGIYKVPMSNMPPAFQTQYGYSPGNASNFLAVETKRNREWIEAERARQIQQQQMLVALGYTNQIITVTAVWDLISNHGIPLVSTAQNPDGILIRGIPVSVINFVADYNQLSDDIVTVGKNIGREDLAAKKAQLLANDVFLVVQDGEVHRDTYAKAVSVNRANRMSVNVLDAQFRWEQMTNRFGEMQSHLAENSSIVACPTTEIYGNYRVWQFAGMVPSTAGSSQ